MTKLKLLWIDDDNSRVNFKRGIESYKYGTGTNELKADVEFLPVNKFDPIQIITEKLLPNTKYNLILIDHMLTHTKGAGRKGTIIAEIVREIFPNIPIVGVTAATNMTHIDQHVLSIYDDLFYIDKLSDSFSSILIIAETFKKLNKLNISSQKAKLKLFLPPHDDIPILEQILPSTLVNRKNIRSEIRTLANWALHELINNPGLLYDQKWTANLIGVKESSFNKIEKLFTEAKYEGIFSNIDKPRWWKSTIKQIVFSKTKNKKTSLPWEAGHSLPGILERDFSVCHYCNNVFPETLGYVDTSENGHIIPLHYSHSKKHPFLQSKLYFDEIRVMKDT